MKAGRYNIKELFVNRDLEQIVIPEIQRDYVWKDSQVLGLLDSIKSDFMEVSKLEVPEINTDDKLLIQDFNDYYKKRNGSSNIGFIYAYNDNEYPGKYFLIDGQQRITTIYLVLLALASSSKELKEKFKKNYLKDGELKLDYKVRELTNKFFSKFVSFSLSKKKKLKNQFWYFNEYNIDVTAKNIVKNYNTISTFLKNNDLKNKAFFDYIENQLEFWYFDTNLSKQGEELYIYMNARGEQMQSNENIKADLLSHFENDELKNSYGTKWENWQDFFWLHRGRNENADKGFNEFLGCISGLENYIKGDKSQLYSKEQFDKDNYIKIIDILKTINLLKIEKYFKGLEFLEKNKKSFKSNYNYSDWVDNALKEIWKILNSKEQTNWYANYNDNNRSTERNKMVFLWSVFYYISNVNLETIDKVEVFRLLRVFYVRYNNYNRSVTSLKNTIDNFITNGVIQNFESIISEVDIELEEEETDKNIFTHEELLKHKLLSSNHSVIENQRNIESLLWEIEDHELNLNGRDVGNKNISYLINDFESIDLNVLKVIRDKFYELFPLDTKNHLTVQNILLYYGKFWKRVTPHYYTNYQFNDWRRIIRDLGENKDEMRVVFNLFFKDFLSYEGSVKDFLKEKREDVIPIEETKNLRKKLIWYNQYIGDEMWKNGNHIVFSNGDYCSLPDWVNHDKIFTNNYIFYNIDKNLQGGVKQPLYELLPKDILNKNKA